MEPNGTGSILGIIYNTSVDLSSNLEPIPKIGDCLDKLNLYKAVVNSALRKIITTIDLTHFAIRAVVRQYRR